MFKRKSIYNQLIYTLIVLCVLNTTTSTINNRIFQSEDDDNAPDAVDTPAIDPKKYRPIFVSVIIAEGAKVPKDPFFSLPFDKLYGQDHLTPIGENQMYNLGSTILNKYKDLFRDPINPEEPIIPQNIYKAWSDSNPACQSSALSFLTGVFPPGFKRPLISSPEFSQTKKPPYNNLKREPYDPNLEDNSSLPSTKPPIFLLRMDSDDQDFLFFSKIAEVCPKKYPFYRKAVQIVNSDILRSLITIEKFLDEKFLKKGFKEISGFEWNISDIRRLQETLESWFSNTTESYNGVDKSFLSKLNNLRGMIELAERNSVPNLTAVENQQMVYKLLYNMSRKISHDKLFLQNRDNETKKAEVEVTANGTKKKKENDEKDKKKQHLDWNRLRSENFTWNMALMSASQERLLSMLSLLELARSEERRVGKEC